LKETFILWMLLVAGVMIAVAIFGYYRAKRRREALAAWAGARGWSFTAERDDRFGDRHGGFECLRRGNNRYAYNISEGRSNGRPSWAFDYHYETYSSSKHGRRTRHHHFSAVIIAPDMLLKPLFIRPENFLDKVTEFFGYDDIDFESVEFSRKFFVKSPDKKWAYDVIGQPTMELLLAAPRFTLALDRSGAIAYRGQTFEAPDFDAALNLLEGVFERLPSSLVRELQPGRSDA
jgi:hypothetical protein